MLLLPKHDASEPSRDEFSPSVLEPRISCGIDRSKSLTPQVDGQRHSGSGGSRSPPSLSRGSRPKTSSWSNRTVACSVAKSSVLQNARSPGRLGFLDRPRVFILGSAPSPTLSACVTDSLSRLLKIINRPSSHLHMRFNISLQRIKSFVQKSVHELLRNLWPLCILIVYSPFLDTFLDYWALRSVVKAKQ